MSTTADLVRQARNADAQSQRALARHAGIAQPTIAAIESGRRDATLTTVARLVEAAGCRLAVLPTTSSTTADTATAIRADLQARREPRAFRRVIQHADDLRREPPATAVALAVLTPPPTGTALYDALVAATVEHCLRARRLPVPAWVHEPDRRLSEPTPVDPDPSYQAEAQRTAPAAFRRHNVLILPTDLASM